jgi:hypothetical protein
MAEVDSQKVTTHAPATHARLLRRYILARRLLFVAVESRWRQYVETGEVERLWESGAEERGCGRGKGGVWCDT